MAVVWNITANGRAVARVAMALATIKKTRRQRAMSMRRRRGSNRVMKFLKVREERGRRLDGVRKNGTVYGPFYKVWVIGILLSIITLF